MEETLQWQNTPIEVFYGQKKQQVEDRLSSTIDELIEQL